MPAAPDPICQASAAGRLSGPVHPETGRFSGSGWTSTERRGTVRLGLRSRSSLAMGGWSRALCRGPGLTLAPLAACGPGVGRRQGSSAGVEMRCASTNQRRRGFRVLRWPHLQELKAPCRRLRHARVLGSPKPNVDEFAPPKPALPPAIAPARVLAQAPSAVLMHTKSNRNCPKQFMCQTDGSPVAFLGHSCTPAPGPSPLLGAPSPADARLIAPREGTVRPQVTGPKLASSLDPAHSLLPSPSSLPHANITKALAGPRNVPHTYPVAFDSVGLGFDFPLFLFLACPIVIPLSPPSTTTTPGSETS